MEFDGCSEAECDRSKKRFEELEALRREVRKTVAEWNNNQALANIGCGIEDVDDKSGLILELLKSADREKKKFALRHAGEWLDPDPWFARILLKYVLSDEITIIGYAILCICELDLKAKDGFFRDLLLRVKDHFGSDSEIALFVDFLLGEPTSPDELARLDELFNRILEHD